MSEPNLLRPAPIRPSAAATTFETSTGLKRSFDNGSSDSDESNGQNKHKRIRGEETKDIGSAFGGSGAFRAGKSFGYSDNSEHKMPGVSDTAENELQQENGEDEEDNIDDNDSGNEDDGEEQAGLKGYQEDSDIEETTTPKDFHKTPLPLIKKLTVRESALADEIWNLLGIPDPDNTLESLGDSDYVPISFRPDYDHPLANQLSKLLSGAPAIMEPIRASTPSTPQPSDSQTLSSRVQSPNVMLDPEHEQFQPSRTSTPVNDFLLRTRTPSPAVGIEAGGTPSTATPVPGMREHVLRRTLTRGSSFRLQLERDL